MITGSESAGPGWKILNRVAGAAALATVLLHIA
jgi:hypothetical protein